VQTAGGVAVTFVAATFANFLTVAAKVTEGLNKLGVVSDEAYGTLQAKADAANATVNALVEQTAEYGRKAQQAGKDAANAFDNTEKAAKKTANETKKANEEVKKTTEELIKAGKAQEESLRGQLAAVDGQIPQAVDAAREAWDKYYLSSGEAREKALENLKASQEEESQLRIEASELAEKLAKNQAAGENLAKKAAEERAAAQKKAADTARGALTELGVDVNKVMTGISNDAQIAIDGLDGLVNEIELAGFTAQNSAKAFEDGFNNAIESVNTRGELDELKAKIESLKESGDIGAEGFKKALDTIEKKSKQVAANLDSDLRNAINNASTAKGLEEIKGQLEEAGKAGVDTSKILVLIRQRLQEIRGDEFDDLQDNVEGAGGAVDKLAEKTTEAGDKAEDAADKSKGAFDAFGAALTKARETVTALSSAARNLFEAKIGGNAFVNESESASESLEKTRRRVDELESSRRRLMSNSFAAWFTDTALAAQVVKKEFLEQKVAADALIESIQAGNVSLNQMSAASLKASGQFDLLDDQTLSELQSAIDSARSKLESLNSSAESTLNGLRQRLADIQGDTEEAQRLQYEAERKRLQEQLEQARQAGANNAAADYAQALDQLAKINQIEQQNRSEEENEREKAAADRQRQQEQAERERQRDERQRNTTTNRQQNQASSPRQTIVLQTPSGGQTEVQTDDPDGFLSVLEQAGLRSAQ
jgi:hypothetical protein